MSFHHLGGEVKVSIPSHGVAKARAAAKASQSNVSSDRCLGHIAAKARVEIGAPGDPDDLFGAPNSREPWVWQLPPPTVPRKKKKPADGAGTGSSTDPSAADPSAADTPAAEPNADEQAPAVDVKERMEVVYLEEKKITKPAQLESFMKEVEEKLRREFYTMYFGINTPEELQEREAALFNEWDQKARHGKKEYEDAIIDRRKHYNIFRGNLPVPILEYEARRMLPGYVRDATGLNYARLSHTHNQLGKWIETWWKKRLPNATKVQSQKSPIQGENTRLSREQGAAYLARRALIAGPTETRIPDDSTPGYESHRTRADHLLDNEYDKGVMAERTRTAANAMLDHFMNNNNIDAYFDMEMIQQINGQMDTQEVEANRRAAEESIRRREDTERRWDSSAREAEEAADLTAAEASAARATATANAVVTAAEAKVQTAAKERKKAENKAKEAEKEAKRVESEREREVLNNAKEIMKEIVTSVLKEAAAEKKAVTKRKAEEAARLAKVAAAEKKAAEAAEAKAKADLRRRRQKEYAARMAAIVATKAKDVVADLILYKRRAFLNQRSTELRYRMLGMAGELDEMLQEYSALEDAENKEEERRTNDYNKAMVEYQSLTQEQKNQHPAPSTRYSLRLTYDTSRAMRDDDDLLKVNEDEDEDEDEDESRLPRTLNVKSEDRAPDWLAAASGVMAIVAESWNDLANPQPAQSTASASANVPSTSTRASSSAVVALKAYLNAKKAEYVPEEAVNLYDVDEDVRVDVAFDWNDMYSQKKIDRLFMGPTPPFLKKTGNRGKSGANEGKLISSYFNAELPEKYYHTGGGVDDEDDLDYDHVMIYDGRAEEQGTWVNNKWTPDRNAEGKPIMVSGLEKLRDADAHLLESMAYDDPHAPRRPGESPVWNVYNPWGFSIPPTTMETLKAALEKWMENERLKGGGSLANKAQEKWDEDTTLEKRINVLIYFDIPFERDNWRRLGLKWIHYKQWQDATASIRREMLDDWIKNNAPNPDTSDVQNLGNRAWSMRRAKSNARNITNRQVQLWLEQTPEGSYTRNSELVNKEFTTSPQYTGYQNPKTEEEKVQRNAIYLDLARRMIGNGEVPADDDVGAESDGDGSYAGDSDGPVEYDDDLTDDELDGATEEEKDYHAGKRLFMFYDDDFNEYDNINKDDANMTRTKEEVIAEGRKKRQEIKDFVDKSADEPNQPATGQINADAMALLREQREKEDAEDEKAMTTEEDSSDDDVPLSNRAGKKLVNDESNSDDDVPLSNRAGKKLVNDESISDDDVPLSNRAGKKSVKKQRLDAAASKALTALETRLDRLAGLGSGAKRWNERAAWWSTTVV